MYYKTLKREQITKLKNEKLYSEMIEAIKQADVLAYGDIRNLLFDRELGTNVLTEFATGKDSESESLLEIAFQIKTQIDSIFPGILSNLTNVPDTLGSTLGLKLMSKFNGVGLD